MALALSNPNDRRRINLIARAVVKGDIDSAQSGVKQWLENAHKPKAARPPWMQRRAVQLGLSTTGKTAKKGQPSISRGPQGAGESFRAALMEGLPKQSKADKAAYTAAKTAVRKAFEQMGGPSYSTQEGIRHIPNTKAAAALVRSGKASSMKEAFAKLPAGQRTIQKKFKNTYSKRAAKSHAGRYLKRNDPHGKKQRYSERYPGRKTPMAFGKATDYMVVSPDDVQAWNLSRQHGRKSGKAPYGKIPAGNKTSGSDRGHRIPWLDVEPATFEFSPGAASPTPPSSMLKRDLQAMAAARGLPTTGTKAQLQTRLFSTKSNPGHMGALALSNPSFRGVGSFVTGYALPVGISGAAAGSVHALAASQGVTAKISEYSSKVPVIGEFVGEYLPFTIQGVLAGSVLALIAPFVGGTAGRYLALTAGGAIAFGGGIDAFNAISHHMSGAPSSDDVLLADSDLGALALGDLALTNASALGDIAYEGGALNGLDFRGGDLSSADYGQASSADAFYSGADFSGPEGQALLNGRDTFLRSFGAPPRRVSQTAGAASHLAGREGHRWGWLVKLVGWQKAQAIAALPPRKRVQILAQLRKAAVASFNRLMLESKVLSAEASSPNAELRPVSGISTEGAHGAAGASNYLGDPALFQGA